MGTQFRPLGTTARERERERVIKKIKKDGGYYGFEALLTPYGQVEVWISS